jgi:hypothetical protein
LSAKNWFVSAVKIAAQGFSPTAMLSQWLDETQTAKIVAGLDRLEDPLGNYGPKAKELAAELYSRSIPAPASSNSESKSYDMQTVRSAAFSELESEQIHRNPLMFGGVGALNLRTHTWRDSCDETVKPSYASGLISH